MSIVPASALSSSDLDHLGNNLRPAARADYDDRLEAVNRSLVVYREAVDELHPRRRIVSAKRPATVGTRPRDPAAEDASCVSKRT